MTRHAGTVGRIVLKEMPVCMNTAVILVVVCASFACGLGAGEQAEPVLIPRPTALRMDAGVLQLTKDSRIVAAAQALAPLAAVVVDEINRVKTRIFGVGLRSRPEPMGCSR